MNIKAGKYYLYKGSNFPEEKVLCTRTCYPYAEISREGLDPIAAEWYVSQNELYEIEEDAIDMILPVNAQERKQIPIVSGVLDYFPLAIAEVAKCSKAGNDQHHPDKELHWDKTKSNDHADCIGRHLIDRGKFDTDGQRHSAKLAWRALALLQLELEKETKRYTHTAGQQHNQE